MLLELTTNQKGLVAETATIHEAVKRGICVSQPLDDERYDLILDLPTGLLRVQCKWAPRSADVVVVRCSSNRRTRRGLLRRIYTSDEIDAIAAYCPDVRCCYLLPAGLFAGRSQVHLRLSPSRNNQAVGIHWAKDFEFGATLQGLPGP